MRRLLLSVVMVGGLFVLSGGGARGAGAQVPPPPPAPPTRVPLPTPQRGDLVYAFANEEPLFDPRVGAALAVLVTQQLDPSVRSHILPADESLRIVSAPDQVPLLLAAAGFPGHPPFTEVGQCKIWVAPPPVDVQVTVPYGQAAKEFEAAFLAAMGQLGVTIQPCAIVATPDQAHILLWYQGGPAPAIPRRAPATFLTGAPLPPRVGPGSPPTAPGTGNSVAREGTGVLVVDRAGLLVAALALIGVSVMAVRRLRR